MGNQLTRSQFHTNRAADDGAAPSPLCAPAFGDCGGALKWRGGLHGSEQSIIRLVVALLCMMWVSLAGAVVPQGPPFQVSTNESMVGNYGFRGWDVAMDHAGNSVVVWHQTGPNSLNVPQPFGRRYDPAGVAIGDAFRVDAAIPYSGYMAEPRVAMNSQRFAVVWYAAPIANGSVYGKLFDIATGDTLGQEFLTVSDVNYYGKPDVAMNAAGEFVVVWGSVDASGAIVLARRYGPTGAQLGDTIEVSGRGVGRQYPNVAMDASGGFVVTWITGNEPFARVFDASGSPLGAEFVVTQQGGGASGADVARHEDGSFMVVLVALGGGTPGVIGVMYDATGTPIGPELVIVPAGTIATEPTVAAAACGGYVVTWRGGPPDAIYGKVLDGHGGDASGAFLVGSSEGFYASFPGVAAGGDGSFIVVWMESAVDSGGYGRTIARRFQLDSCSNSPPTADAGNGADIECASPEGAQVLLDGSGSTDTDSSPGTNDDILRFDWYEHFGGPLQVYLGSGEQLEVTMPLGVHLITVKVTDRAGATDTDEVSKTVVDTTPPTISVVIGPDLLWPPNHRTVDIAASVIVHDSCSISAIALVSVTSNEADNGEGDGNTTNDIQGVDVGAADFQFKLRAERAGGGGGRIYTAIYTAEDGSGNVASQAGFVLVPHDQSGVTDPVAVSVEENGSGTLVRWSEAPGAQTYDVIRGRLSSIAERSVVIDLGTVTCLENDSIDVSTEGWEDGETPGPGEGFFYLVQYSDGTSSSYGADTATKPRAPGSGACGE